MAGDHLTVMADQPSRAARASIRPGFYWARRKTMGGDLTVVQIDADLEVMFICNLHILTLFQAAQEIELLGRIPQPGETG